MPLGDSITQAADDHDSYRRPLWQLLTNGGFNVDFVGSLDTNDGGGPPHPDFDLDHEGHWGLRADQILANITAWTTAAQPDIVLIHLGSNDVIQGQSNASTITDLRNIIRAIKAVKPQVKILLAQIIPHNLSGTPSVSGLNALIPQLAADESTSASPVFVVDMATGFNAATMTYDDVHPTLAGETLLAERWYVALGGVLTGTPFPTSTITSTPTITSTATSTITATVTSSRTSTATPTNTSTATGTFTASATSSRTSTVAATSTSTNTSAVTATSTASATPSRTSTAAPTSTNTSTSTSAPGAATFYRAINLAGAAVVIDGNNWEANTGTTPNFTTNGMPFCATWQSLTPTTDAARTSMIQCSQQHWAHNAVMSGVPNGTYQVYVYTWLDWTDPNPSAYSFSVQGQLVQANYQSGPVGKWDRLGPWTATVTAGTITVQTSGGLANLSGIEVYFLGAPATATPSRTATASSTPSTTLTPSATRTITATITMTLSRTPTQFMTATPSMTLTRSRTPVPSTTPGGCGDDICPSNTPNATWTASRTATASVTASASSTSTRTPTAPPPPTEPPTGCNDDPCTATPSVTNTASSTSTASVTASASSTSTATLTPSATITVTPSNTSTPTSSATTTKTRTPTAVPSATEGGCGDSCDTVTPSATKTETSTATASVTASASSTSTETFTPSATITATPSNTSTPTSSATTTKTRTPTAVPSETPGGEETLTPSFTATLTASATSTSTATLTPSATITVTPSKTSTRIISPTPSATVRPSSTPIPTSPDEDTLTPSVTFTPSMTRTATNTPNLTLTITRTRTPTDATTQTATSTPSVTNTPSVASSASASATVTATSGAPSPTFYRAINLGGAPVVIDGHNWEANTGTTPNFTTNGSVLCNPWQVINPPTDANRTTMITCSRQHWAHNAVMSGVPNGIYQVYAYTWLDWADPNPAAYSFSLQGQTVLANYQSGPSGKWDRLGPWTVSVTAGTLTLQTSGGVANLSGIEVYRLDGVVLPTATPTSTVTASRTLTATITRTLTPTRTVTSTRSASPPPPPVPTLWNAYNLNGPDVTINGVVWKAGDATNGVTVTNGTGMCNQTDTLSPSASDSKASMIRCSYDADGTNDMSINIANVPNGFYDVYLTVWEDDAPTTFALTLQSGQVFVPSVTTGTAGWWQRLGAYTVNVTDGNLVIVTSGGLANLSGIELVRR